MALMLITHNMGVVAEMAQPRRRDVCGPGDGGARGRRAVRRARSIPIRRRCWRRCRSAAQGGAARDHPGRGAGPLRPAARLPVRPRCAYATEHSRDVRPDLRPWAGGQRALPLSAGRSDARGGDRGRPARRRGGRVMSAARRRSRRTCTRVYEVRRGLFKQPAQLQAVGGVSFTIEAGQDAGGGRRIRLRQVHAGPHGRR